ncbi:MAG: ATP-dependent helicase, partial [Gemmiger sp.]
LLAGSSRNLFMVGDEDQSIYGFRAACPQALLEFENQWPGAKVLMMEHNYRSSPQIVQAADRFIRQNQARHAKTMTTSNPDGPLVSSLPCADRSEQYRKLAELAREINQNGRQTAVLYRDNDSALPIIDLLARQGIPYQARSVDGLFFQSRLVRDVRDIYRVAKHPHDGEAFLRIYYKLGAGISRQQAEAAVQSGQAILTTLRCMELSGWARSRVQDLQTHFQLLLKDDAAQGITRITEYIGYGAYLEENHIDHGRLDILRTLAEREASLEALFERLEALQQLIREGSTAKSCFCLSTIHSAKGLEYDHVILADVVDGVLPQDPILGQLPTEEQLAALEEERRLFYVGMTRAKRELTLVTFPLWRHPSAFARALFPPPPEQEKTISPSSSRTAANITIAAAPPKATVRMEALAKEYFVGARVVHKSYGKGLVIRREEDTVSIRFDEGKERTFLLTAALSANVLKLEPI